MIPWEFWFVLIVNVLFYKNGCLASNFFSSPMSIQYKYKLTNFFLEITTILLEIITERRVQTFYKHIDVNSAKNAIDEIEVSMIFFAVTFFCVGCKKSPLNQILVRQDRNYCTFENLRQLLCYTWNILKKVVWKREKFLLNKV